MKAIFTPLDIGPMRVKNRVFMAGHGKGLQRNNKLTERYYAYQEERAKGDVGLIVTEILMIDETAKLNQGSILITRDEHIPQFAELARRMHAHDCRIVGQLLHPGYDRWNSDDGSMPQILAPSVLKNERRKLTSRAMSVAQIEETIASYAAAGRRLAEAGLDGVEVVGSHGYLPAQFLSDQTNLRQDDYGGSFEKRTRFLHDVGRAMRAAVGPDFAIGLRLSISDHGPDALSAETVIAACTALDADGVWDYFSVTDGASATLTASYDMIPSMGTEILRSRGAARRLKSQVNARVMVTGRMVDIATAAGVIENGDADMAGMVRPLISDPHLVRKAAEGRTEDIRGCISCNQACIGHIYKGAGIGCIQNPVTGRELQYSQMPHADAPRDILVVGGGPGGMKAAAIAAQRGHRVTLAESASRLGGQANLAQLLPGRSEFGGVVTNLQRELELAQVRVLTNTRVDRAFVEDMAPAEVLLATGGRAHRPQIDQDGGLVLDPWQVLAENADPGKSVVIADWTCDWVALGLAERFATEGRHVRVAVNGMTAGEQLFIYSRNYTLARVMSLGVEIVPYLRLYGISNDTVYLQNILTDEPVIWEGADSVVVCYGQDADDDLAAELQGVRSNVHMLGDCVQPRTAEEAILEGFRIGAAL